MGIFSKHSYPPFFETYLHTFKAKKKNLTNTRFVVFDTETTGLNLHNDRILSIGCIAIQNFSIVVADQLEIYVKQEKFAKESVKIHGLLKFGVFTKVDELEALKVFLNYIKNSVLVAHHAAFDIGMINAILKRNHLPKLKNKVIDTATFYKKTKYVKDNNQYSLDKLCAIFNLKMHDRHTAAGDAYLTALVFLKSYKLLQKKKKNLRLSHFVGWL
ncbi:PolC-type DNA polymerase III [Polaribacter sp. R77954]|uniref:PolC-type DNA polymerase III n=1 Tax=Polaribacter sp. R77954 TaxID=3093870 RepID=UPI0037CBF4AD